MRPMRIGILVAGTMCMSLGIFLYFFEPRLASLFGGDRNLVTVVVSPKWVNQAHIVLTNLSGETDRADAKDEGAMRFLEKSQTTPADLVREVEALTA